MLLQILRNGLDKYSLIMLLLQIPVILFSLSLHEMSHGLAADALGDHTARSMGRITLNPFKHFDLIGTVCMFCFGFGWAKPVPINVLNFEDPKKGMAITGVAGPLSNLCLAFVADLALHVYRFVLSLIDLSEISDGVFILLLIFEILFIVTVQVNVYFAVFNLLPVPPFDGSRFFFALLPERLYFKVMKYERFIMIAVFALIWIGFLDYPLSWLTSTIIKGFDFVIGLVPYL